MASKLTTRWARDMIEGLINGERDPSVLADVARGVMGNKIPHLAMARPWPAPADSVLGTR